MKLFGGIEAGGTKFVCLVGNGPDQLVEEKRFPTTTPDETIARVIEFFAPYSNRGELAAVGIASFGPLDLNPKSKTFGYITTTPKPGWGQIDLCGRIKQSLNVPVTFDTDVNAAAFGEQYWTPENQVLDPFLYMTVGTGIGVGAIVNGLPLHGLMHTEAGHFAIPHNLQRDPFPGVCPYHGDCLEGLASGPSMNKRWGQNAESLTGCTPCLGFGSRIYCLGAGEFNLCIFTSADCIGRRGTGAPRSTCGSAPQSTAANQRLHPLSNGIGKN